jgi:hypothetical protein
LALASALLLLTSCGSSTGDGAGRAQGVVTGIVYSSPSCPVERVDSPCPPRPVIGAEVAAYRGSRRQASTRTDVDGRFRFALAYGHYTIRATNVGGYASTASIGVVVSGVPTAVKLAVDSGIR